MKAGKLRIASLFAGAGGLDLGFIAAGHKVVWANDFDKDACDTYGSNIGQHITWSDIADVKVGEIPDYDILIGGFPCQGFSRANVHRVQNDVRNSLYLHVISILMATKPKFFLLENVRGIKALNGGKDFSEILLALGESGYDVNHQVLNAADYGVPQNRIRVIITGVRKDLAKKYQYVYPPPTHSRDGGELPKWISISEALSRIGEPDDDTGLPNHVFSRYKVTDRDFTGHRRTDPHKPSPTILARGNGGGGVCAIQHPKNHRRLSVRESATIQTFPLSFVFSGGLMSMYRQVGNAVPVKLAECIAAGFRKT
ncbi:MAG: DNA cytosine methyltransferase [Alphaproteobacteria bacterium]|nr:DNA cytosine methyltransferase [Alphaproteobacteria bacterium]MDA8004196.1 DNA cytosine methyltransferase [Alphaproteobacteria bacterium]MDA8006077.1 DNA cytosine methyltransferase [Alphaproteobacteria bacterium]MDA8013464.1 DNA cytosine methyltransferase [Alphaproteobacteria bacterium]